MERSNLSSVKGAKTIRRLFSQLELNVLILQVLPLFPAQYIDRTLALSNRSMEFTKD